MPRHYTLWQLYIFFQFAQSNISNGRRAPPWLRGLGYHVNLHNSGMILGLRPANERRRYFVTTSLIGWAQAWNHHPSISRAVILVRLVVGPHPARHQQYDRADGTTGHVTPQRRDATWSTAKISHCAFCCNEALNNDSRLCWMTLRIHCINNYFVS